MSERKLSTPVVVAAGVLLGLSPWGSPPLGLIAGIILAAVVDLASPKETAKVTRILLQSSVVGLGFGVELGKVIAVSVQGLSLTVITITGALLAGTALARGFKVDRRIGYLISCGTAICGGSAIAAVAPVIDATEEEIAVSLGTVFILNALALFVFPVLGTYLGMSQPEFGLWSAIAIHDTSSVVGAASRYGDEALQIATTVKLARAMWIVPLAIFTAYIFGRRPGKAGLPWFIVLFFVAALVTSYLPGRSLLHPLVSAAKAGLTVTLFLIGVGFSPRRVAAVGFPPLVMGATLWLLVSIVTLLLVRFT